MCARVWTLQQPCVSMYTSVLETITLLSLTCVPRQYMCTTRTWHLPHIHMFCCACRGPFSRTDALILSSLVRQQILA